MTSVPTPTSLATTPPAQQACRDSVEAFLADYSGMEPLCDEERFDRIVANMVDAQAPRLFALVTEYGQRVDAAVTAWGLAFPDHTEIVSVDGRLHTSHFHQTPQDVARRFHVGTQFRARLVWCDPTPPRPPTTMEPREVSPGGRDSSATVSG